LKRFNETKFILKVYTAESMEVLLRSLFYIGRKLGHVVHMKNIGKTTNVVV